MCSLDVKWTLCFIFHFALAVPLIWPFPNAEHIANSRQLCGAPLLPWPPVACTAAYIKGVRLQWGQSVANIMAKPIWHTHHCASTMPPCLVPLPHGKPQRCNKLAVSCASLPHHVISFCILITMQMRLRCMCPNMTQIYFGVRNLFTFLKFSK